MWPAALLERIFKTENFQDREFYKQNQPTMWPAALPEGLLLCAFLCACLWQRCVKRGCSGKHNSTQRTLQFNTENFTSRTQFNTENFTSRPRFAAAKRHSRSTRFAAAKHLLFSCQIDVGIASLASRSV